MDCSVILVRWPFFQFMIKFLKCETTLFIDRLFSERNSVTGIWGNDIRDGMHKEVIS